MRFRNLFDIGHVENGDDKKKGAKINTTAIVKVDTQPEHKYSTPIADNIAKYSKPAHICSATLDDIMDMRPSLRRVLTCKENKFTKLQDAQIVEVTKKSYYNTNDKSRYIYIDKGSSVLGVAHLDYVKPYIVGGKMPYSVVDLVDDVIIYSPTLDDRLGAWILLELLPRLGIECDILLTTDEERCSSTAQYFKASKEYNWMFSFDRQGTDVVMYQYETTKTKAIVEEYGWRSSWGSYSCIADLDSLGVAGFNFGTGYHNQHSTRCHASMVEMLGSVGKFEQFYKDYCETKIPSEGAGKHHRLYSSWDDDRWDTYYDGKYGYSKTRTAKTAKDSINYKYDTCDICGQRSIVRDIAGLLYCTPCSQLTKDIDKGLWAKCEWCDKMALIERYDIDKEIYSLCFTCGSSFEKEIDVDNIMLENEKTICGVCGVSGESLTFFEDVWLCDNCYGFFSKA